MKTYQNDDTNYHYDIMTIEMPSQQFNITKSIGDLRPSKDHQALVSVDQIMSNIPHISRA